MSPVTSSVPVPLSAVEPSNSVPRVDFQRLAAAIDSVPDVASKVSEAIVHRQGMLNADHALIGHAAGEASESVPIPEATDRPIGGVGQRRPDEMVSVTL